ncbi:hypothetical protein FISHEDRAFT_71169 [Fistulina hepatica ATCC 64428]|nr:hypothetical protein FISHEDRAFT_71169 [Fistulina hepatica ATCC 64428]
MSLRIKIPPQGRGSVDTSATATPVPEASPPSHSRKRQHRVADSDDEGFRKYDGVQEPTSSAGPSRPRIIAKRPRATEEPDNSPVHDTAHGLHYEPHGTPDDSPVEPARKRPRRKIKKHVFPDEGYVAPGSSVSRVSTSPSTARTSAVAHPSPKRLSSLADAAATVFPTVGAQEGSSADSPAPKKHRPWADKTPTREKGKAPHHSTAKKSSAKRRKATQDGDGVEAEFAAAVNATELDDATMVDMRDNGDRHAGNARTDVGIADATEKAANDDLLNFDDGPATDVYVDVDGASDEDTFIVDDASNTKKRKALGKGKDKANTNRRGRGAGRGRGGASSKGKAASGKGELKEIKARDERQQAVPEAMTESPRDASSGTLKTGGDATAQHPPKRKFPSIKKNKPPPGTPSLGTPDKAVYPSKAPSASKLSPASPPKPLLASTARKPTTGSGVANADLDLTDKNTYASLFAKPAHGRSGQHKEDPARRKELDRLRDEAKAQREAESKYCFDLQAQFNKIERFEERLRAMKSTALYPSILAAKWFRPPETRLKTPASIVQARAEDASQEKEEGEM